MEESAEKTQMAALRKQNEFSQAAVRKDGNTVDLLFPQSVKSGVGFDELREAAVTAEFDHEARMRFADEHAGAVEMHKAGVICVCFCGGSQLPVDFMGREVGGECQCSRPGCGGLGPSGRSGAAGTGGLRVFCSRGLCVVLRHFFSLWRLLLLGVLGFCG